MRLPKIQTEDWVLWFLAAALAVVLFLVEKAPVTVALSLMVLAAPCVDPVLRLPWSARAYSRGTRAWRSAAILAILFIGVSALGIVVWPPSKRPHLMVYRYDVSPPLNGNPAYFNVWIRNDGELDTEMRGSGNLNLFVVPAPSPQKQREFEEQAFEAMLKTEAYKSAPPLQVAAKNETNVSAVIPPTDAQTSVKLQTGAVSVLLNGRFVYTDKKTERHTDYCLYVQRFQRPFFMCQHHNEAP